MSTENKLLIPGPMQMTSFEIASLVESRHADVLRSIERLAERGTIELPPTAFSERINNLGFEAKLRYFVFKGDKGRRDSIVVVAQLSPEFTARIVDRWQELENRLQATPEETLRLYWQRYRNGAASNYNILMRSVDQVVEAQNPDIPRWTDEFEQKKRFARIEEANFLNTLIIGMTASQYKSYFRDFRPAIRDAFPAKILDAYEQAEILDATLLSGRVPENERREAIDRMLSMKFPQVRLFRDVITEQVRRINFGEVDDESSLIHPAQYHELRADKELLDMLGVQDTLMLTDVWDDIESDRGKAYLGI